MSGRISIDNLSDSLKEMIANSGSGLSEEQVLNLINENGLSEEQVLNLVKNNLTGDITQLSTQEKGSIVGAINELFQSANNGKQLIANAIGEPLSKEDTFSAMSNDINSLLSTFKTNMMNNGITVESGDKFKSLIDKIATMVEEGSGKGIQFVEGTSVAITDTFAGEAYRGFDIDIKSLGFKPYIIIGIYIGTADREGDNCCISLYLKELSTYYKDSNIMVSVLRGNANDPNHKTISSKITDDNYRLYTRASVGSTIKWYAIGVGEEDTTLRDSLASILEDEGVEVLEEDTMASLIGKVDEEFDRQVVPQGTATINDVVSGKTFINSTGQLLTGTASKGLATTTGTVNVSSTLYTSKSFTINIDFTPTRLILIVPKVWYNSGVIEHKNVIVTNETTTLNAGPNENGTIKVSSMTSYSFNIQMSGLQIPSCTITWIAIG